LRRYLEANGFDAKEAYDGIDCLEKLEEQLPDAVVLDVMMPRMDGYETVKRIKEQAHTKHIPVVIVTALNDVANQLKSIEAGADDFLSKPIEEKLLIAKVRLLSNLNIHQMDSKNLQNALDKSLKGDYQGKSLADVLNELNIS
jgi:two-component system cell cycle response regulator